jgi:putative oxidoreductase
MSIALSATKALLAAAFLGAGGMKLSGNPKMAGNFARWGFLSWFMTLVGAAEVAGGIGLLVPQTRTFAAAGLILVMVGAAGTHLGHEEYAESAPALILTALLAAVLLLGGSASYL